MGNLTGVFFLGRVPGPKGRVRGCDKGGKLSAEGLRCARFCGERF